MPATGRVLPAAPANTSASPAGVRVASGTRRDSLAQARPQPGVQAQRRRQTSGRVSGQIARPFGSGSTSHHYAEPNAVQTMPWSYRQDGAFKGRMVEFMP